MVYFVTFLEGIITFISPCMLPMLPVYVSYFAGNSQNTNSAKAIINSVGFVLGFTVVFVLLGAFAASVGAFLREYQAILNIITGIVVIFFGLNFIGIFQLNIFKGINNFKVKKEFGFVSSFVFGLVFSIGWTPCVGTFLGSALMLASQKGNIIAGIVMLLAYSMGLGIPFVISAVIIDKLKGTFDIIKKHYGIINKVSGILLVVVGTLMITGLMGKYLNFLG
jgi:cytochrome c-type biogenesis protein